jgi:hypothetical protein
MHFLVCATIYSRLSGSGPFDIQLLLQSFNFKRFVGASQNLCCNAIKTVPASLDKALT